MNPIQFINNTQDKLHSTAAHFQDEIKKIRTGRAHPNMLDGVMVEVYGTQLPLNQVASISAPEGQLLQITPFDPNNLKVIANAIRDNQTL